MIIDDPRKPTERPLRCFGSEFRSTDPICQRCAHQPACIVASDFRAERVTLDRIKFNLTKEEWRLSLEAFEDKASSVNDIFVACHTAVFTRPPKFKIPLDKAVTILKMAKQTDCGLQLFMTAVMLAHSRQKQSSFYPNLLWGPSAVKCIERYRNACHKAYGHFDIRAVEKMVDMTADSSDLEQQMLNSEIIFGNYIVSLKIRGRPVIFNSVFILKEIDLAPVWLATEPAYGEVLNGTENVPNTDGLRKHRQNVARILKHANKNPKTLIVLNKAREKILHSAIKTVLSYHGLQPTDFEMPDRVIVTARSFWQKLGDVLQWYYCRKAINGDKHAMRKISL